MHRFIVKALGPMGPFQIMDTQSRRWVSVPRRTWEPLRFSTPDVARHYARVLEQRRRID